MGAVVVFVLFPNMIKSGLNGTLWIKEFPIFGRESEQAPPAARNVTLGTPRITDKSLNWKIRLWPIINTRFTIHRE